MEERAEREDKAGVSRNATPESDSKGSHISQGSPVRESPNSSRWYPEATSPGKNVLLVLYLFMTLADSVQQATSEDTAAAF